MKLPFITLLLIAAAMPTPAQDTDCFCRIDFVAQVKTTEGRYINNAVIALTGCTDLPCTATATQYARSNGFGYFTFRNLLLIDYVIEISAKGYQPYATLVPMYDYAPYETFTLLRLGQARTKNAAAAFNSDTPREPSRSFFFMASPD